MPIVMDGYAVVSADTLREHAGHPLTVPAEPGDLFGTRLWCERCAGEVARVHRPPVTLSCGCRDTDEHAEGVTLQATLRNRYRVRSRNRCIGCEAGDDGPSVHSCMLHPLSAEDWRIIDHA